ncbi:uncharacterized protein LOC131616147 [Vicia villosa]|uniref:uncharacterized protein LOC131616147 n=1 Tax=Vicia villosa TaxID=3911 RepID=UPI00273C8454|nr:uncharacterized protein LOC131616147 [Vicia villosa]
MEPESSVERGRRLKSKRNHVEADLVDDVKRGSPPKSDRNSSKKAARKKQFVADREKRKQRRIAKAEYDRITRNQSIYDLTVGPPRGNCGGIRPLRIDKSIRPSLNEYCKFALKKFNNYKKNIQDPEFVFVDVVKSTHGSPRIFYITFKAKRQDASPIIFQAHVWHRLDGSIEVFSCTIKKD